MVLVFAGVRVLCYAVTRSNDWHAPTLYVSNAQHNTAELSERPLVVSFVCKNMMSLRRYRGKPGKLRLCSENEATGIVCVVDCASRYEASAQGATRCLRSPFNGIREK